MTRSIIRATGAYVPEKVLSNFDLEKLVETSDEWILQRTGIRERRIVAEGQATSDLAHEAAKTALQGAGIHPEDLDGIIVCTISPDQLSPSVACLVQERLGAVKAAAFDMNAACTGFIYGLATANGLITSGVWRTVLVIGAESLSRFVDFTDRNTCILFGDGAGAVVLSASEKGEGSGLLDHYLRSNGAGKDLISIPGGGSRHPASAATLADHLHFLKMQGREVFKFATRSMVELLETAFQRNGIGVEDLDLIVPHQVNYRVIETVRRKIPLPEERIFLNLDRYGNTSAASVPIALHEAASEGRLKRGDLVLLVAFGAGLTWGYNLIRW